MRPRAAGYVEPMQPQDMSRRQRWTLGTFVFRFPQVHLGIGIVGNALFLVGTVLFLVGQQGVGVWFFLVGSCGMLLGSVGEGLRALGKHRLGRFDVDPRYPDHAWSARGQESSVGQ